MSKKAVHLSAENGDTICKQLSSPYQKTLVTDEPEKVTCRKCQRFRDKGGV